MATDALILEKMLTSAIIIHLIKWPTTLKKTNLLILLCLVTLAGCTSARAPVPQTQPDQSLETQLLETSDYLIGAGDMLNVFVWRHPEVSVTVPVRPDGKISTPLVEDVVALGKTPTQLAREVEGILATYIKQPEVTVIVSAFGDAYGQQVRVVGQAVAPQALRYRENMTLLDVMINVGGLTEFAAGNKSTVVRSVDGRQNKFRVRLADLLEGGDISANVTMMPGDILVIPESWF